MDVELDRGPVRPAAPSLQVAARLPPELDADDLLDVRVRAHCGGAGPSGDGAVLYGWGTVDPAGAWLPLAATAAGVPVTSAAAGRMDYAPASGPDAARELLGPDQRMIFQCRPSAASGAGFARVALDYLEVRVKYAVAP